LKDGGFSDPPSFFGIHQVQQESMSAANQETYRAIAGLIKKGDVTAALVQLDALLSEFPEDVTALSMAGSAHMQAGDQDKAFENFEAAITAYPNSFSAHADLAFAAMKYGQSLRSITHFTKATDINPDFYPAWRFLEKLLYEAGDYPAALHAVQRAEDLDPLDADYRKMQTELTAGRPAQVEKIARAMIKREPGHPRGVFMLSHLANNVGAEEECTKILKYGLEHHPANLMLRRALIRNLEKLAAYIPAVIEAEELTKVSPDYRSWLLLSKVHGHTGAHTFALEAAEEAARHIEPDSGELGKVDLLRGHALKILGRRAESEQAYRDCIINTPGNGAGWWGLADFKNYEFTEDDKRVMGSLARQDDADPPQRCQAAFALAKAHEVAGDDAEAFNWYKLANDLRPDVKFDGDKHDDFCQCIIGGYDVGMLAQQALPQRNDPTPIFIVGMPRAGSTLIEQILASHSQIEGTMELMTLPKLERRITIAGGKLFDEKYPASFAHFSTEDLSAFGQNYLNETAMYRTDKAFFIDKLPPNFERIGMIHKILPHAIIIDARRHPMDCGLSAYKQHFAGGHEYSYDLANIGRYYNSYLSIMDHFDAVLPGRIFRVQYEENVRDTEGMIRRLLDHIGLDFEPACLEFYKNKRAVRTASSEQVRQPIYTKSVASWKRYETQLAALAKALGPATLNRFDQGQDLANG
jgi:tetratricopeptide (TPR) repeat protein